MRIRIANRQSVAGIVTRPADAVTVTSRQTGNTGGNATASIAHHHQNSKPSISNSVSILEKQLARMQIVPSADRREREILYNCTKMLDGEFNLQDTNVLERCLLSDGQSANQSSTTPSGQSFCIVGAVGLDGVGKSTLLNTIANRNVFKTHRNIADDRRNMTASSTAPKGSNSGQDNPLSHVTSGVDLHITSERLFLLDTQPLLSASILDDFLRNTGNTGASMFSGGSNFSNHHHHNHHHNHTSNNSGAFSLSSVMGFDITEPENFSYIYSMQLLTFMFSICDHLVLVLDSNSLDVYLLKLVASSLMMVGETVPKANLIIYLKPRQEQLSPTLSSQTNTPGASFKKSKEIKQQQTFSSGFKINSPTPQRSASHNRMLQLLKNTIVAMLGPNVNIDFITDEQRLLATVLKPPSRNLLLTDSQSRPISYTTERAWFHSVQRFWDNSIHKSTLFADYARYLP